MQKLIKVILVSTLALAAVAEAKPAPPKLEDYTHECKKCGGATHYPKSCTGPRSTVEGLRDGCVKLRSLGLDITLDESVLCRHCVSADKLKIPRFATVVSRPEKSNLRPGDQVEFLYFADYKWWRVVPKGNRVWINRKYIDDDGNILGNNVCVRLRPSTEGTWYSHVNKGTKVKILETRQDWVAVEWHNPWPDKAPPSCFGEIEYGEGEDASLSRIVNRLEWIIKGRRSRANLNDMDLLLAYMRGQKEVQVGCLMCPIEDYRPRINELISAPGETDVVAAARRQIGVTAGYDPAYRKIGHSGLGAMAGGPSARKDVQAAKTLNATNAEDIVRRWCRSPDAFVKDETLSIPMQCGQIPDDVKSACRILASKNPDVLLAAYSVLILRDYEYRFRDIGQYPPTHIDPWIPWEIARWTLSRLGLIWELRRAEDEGVEIGISPYVDGILGRYEEIFKDDLYGMELAARVKVLRDKLKYRYMCQGLDTFRESIPSVDDVREYRFWEGKDFSFRSVRTNDVCRGSFVCLHKVEKSVGDKVLQLLASARGNGGWSHSYGDDKPFRFRELDCVLQNGDTVTIKVRINDGLSSGFIICSARKCRDSLICPPQEIWRELSEIFLKVSEEASGSVHAWYRSRPLPCSYRVGDGPDGGTLSGVARLFYGNASRWPVIHSANNGLLTDPNKVRPGLTLTIPRFQNDSTAARVGTRTEPSPAAASERSR